MDQRRGDALTVRRAPGRFALNYMCF